MTDPDRPLLGEPNAPCRSCGAPLAADQRYCLQCGTRRAEARLPFLDILARQVPGGGTAVTGTTTTRSATGRSGAGPLGRMSTNAAAVAGVACLLLALGVGVLIGGMGDGGSAGALPPQIITVGGGGVTPAPAPSTTAPPSTTTPDPGATGTGTGTKKKSSSKSAQSSSGSKAASKALKNLNSSSGSDYSKKSEKLPKTLGTGGKPPPVDKSVPAGGGSAVQSIG